MRTVDDLIQEVRDQVDEQNQAAKSDDAMLRLLNRGLSIVQQQLAIRYPEPLLADETLDLSDGTTHAIPEDAFEDRVEFIQVETAGGPAPTRMRTYRDGTRLYMSGSTSVPFSWHILGRNIVFQQTPSGTYDATAFYIRRLEQLVPMQGLLTTVGAAYVVVDTETLRDVAPLISADGDSLNSYINFVNRMTGEIRATYQISSISSNRINLRTTPVRSSVHGRTVSGSASFAASGVAVDDYVCLVRGTCVPYYQDLLANYVVQYAVAELTRGPKGAGGDARLEQQVLGYREDQVAASPAGREATTRVVNRSPHWGPASRGRVPR